VGTRGTPLGSTSILVRGDPEALSGQATGILEAKRRSMDLSPVEKLRRWELSGGTWHVLHRSGTHTVVELCACTGEPMERLSSSNRELLDYLAARPDANAE
jgi:hypothetical protein